MIINETSLDVASNVTGERMTLSVNSTSINVILGNLYQDPHRAMVRELCSNAYDAHVSAQNLEQPYVVQIPTVSNPVFGLRDYGPGLDFEGVNQYLNQLYSTTKKTDSNQLGGFGIGSKTPFALVDSFTLYAYKDGMEYQCCWFKDEEGVPVLHLLSASETEEPNGIKYEVPVTEEDALLINKALLTELLFIPLRPTFCYDLSDVQGSYIDLFTEADINILPYDGYSFINDPHNSLGFAGQQGYYTQQRVCITMGGILYPVISGVESQLFRIFNTTNVTNLFKLLVIHLPIGELQLAQTRETLLNNQYNLEKLTSIVTTTCEKIIGDLLENFNETKVYDDSDEYHIQLIHFLLERSVQLSPQIFTRFPMHEGTPDGPILHMLKEKVTEDRRNLINSASLLNNYYYDGSGHYKLIISAAELNKQTGRLLTSASYVYRYLTETLLTHDLSSTVFIVQDTPRLPKAAIRNSKYYLDKTVIILQSDGFSWEEILTYFKFCLSAIPMEKQLGIKIIKSSEVVVPTGDDCVVAEEVQRSTTITSYPGIRLVTGKTLRYTTHINYKETGESITRQYSNGGKALPWSPEYLSLPPRDEEDLQPLICYIVMPDTGEYVIDQLVSHYLKSLPNFTDEMKTYLVLPKQLESFEQNLVGIDAEVIRLDTFEVPLESFNKDTLLQCIRWKLLCSIPERYLEYRDNLLKVYEEGSLLGSDYNYCFEGSSYYSLHHRPTGDSLHHLAVCRHYDEIVEKHGIHFGLILPSPYFSNTSAYELLCHVHTEPVIRHMLLSEVKPQDD